MSEQEKKIPREEMKSKALKFLKARVCESVCGIFDDMDGQHAEFFSTALEVRVSPRKGRGVFACEAQY